jgi:hypothetical protein
MVNNVIGVVNYVIAARPSLLNFMIADTTPSTHSLRGVRFLRRRRATGQRGRRRVLAGHVRGLSQGRDGPGAAGQGSLDFF